MDTDVRGFTREAFKVIGLQALIVVLVGAGFFVFDGWWSALSEGFGGLAGITATMLLARRVETAGRLAKQDPRRSMRLFYAGAAQRYVWVAVMLGCGFILFKFDPLPLIIGLFLPHLGYIVVLRGLRRARRE